MLLTKIQKAVQTDLSNNHSVTFLDTKFDERLMHTTSLKNMLKSYLRVHVPDPNVNIFHMMHPKHDRDSIWPFNGQYWYSRSSIQRYRHFYVGKKKMKDVKSNKELQLEVVIKALSLLVQINVGKSLFSLMSNLSKSLEQSIQSN